MTKKFRFVIDNRKKEEKTIYVDFYLATAASRVSREARSQLGTRLERDCFEKPRYSDARSVSLFKQLA